MNGLTEKAGRVVAALQKAKQTLATAESCTGGLIAASITAVPGSSTCFGYGVVSYSNQAKMDVLRVQAQTLARFGAVSEQTAYEMAQGLRALSAADIAVSVTGIAGPGGGSPEKPVGLVYIATATAGGVCARRFLFQGDRQDIRCQTAWHAFEMVEDAIRSSL